MKNIVKFESVSRFEGEALEADLKLQKLDRPHIVETRAALAAAEWISLIILGLLLIAVITGKS
jgi:hypothetical protein